MRQPQALRPQIGIFGRRNTGKSSLMNYLTGCETALVSPVAGTTTDPVRKNVEIPPIGPVTLVDTAGIDDKGELGTLRTHMAERQIGAVHLGLLVSDGIWGNYEERIVAGLKARGIPSVVVWSKSDIASPDETALHEVAQLGITSVPVSSVQERGLKDLISAILRALPEEALAPPSMLRDILPPGGLCLFVAPIDQSAPKARLIQPQVQTLRDCLDSHALSLVIQPEELKAALDILREPPHLLVCDTQAVHICVQDTPASLPLTTYSILMARLKGDLPTLAAGAAAIHSLQGGDMVCISEVCAHHAQSDDIGRVKIPALLRQCTGRNLDIRFATGRAYPENVKDYKLIIHCGGCMINRPVMLSRMAESAQAGVPITSYGVAISLLRGVLERALQIFPNALAAYKAAVVHGETLLQEREAQACERC